MIFCIVFAQKELLFINNFLSPKNKIVSILPYGVLNLMNEPHGGSEISWHIGGFSKTKTLITETICIKFNWNFQNGGRGKS